MDGNALTSTKTNFWLFVWEEEQLSVDTGIYAMKESDDKFLVVTQLLLQLCLPSSSEQ